MTDTSCSRDVLLHHSTSSFHRSNLQCVARSPVDRSVNWYTTYLADANHHPHIPCMNQPQGIAEASMNSPLRPRSGGSRGSCAPRLVRALGRADTDLTAGPWGYLQAIGFPFRTTQHPNWTTLGIPQKKLSQR